jgi:ATPase family AAA domain-containing protein 3A/B
MSWLFGYKSQTPQVPEGMDPNASGGQQQMGAGGPAQDQQLTKAEKKAMEAYRFDSTALERAAEAAKTLEKSSKFFFVITSYLAMLECCHTKSI